MKYLDDILRSLLSSFYIHGKVSNDRGCCFITHLLQSRLQHLPG